MAFPPLKKRPVDSQVRRANAPHPPLNPVALDARGTPWLGGPAEA